MPPGAPVSPAISARIIHAALVIGVLLFCLVAWYLGRASPVPATSQDEWWRVNLGKAVTIWALVEAPALLGLIAYSLTYDFRALIATLTGLLLFGNYRPSRLIER